MSKVEIQEKDLVKKVTDVCKKLEEVGGLKHVYFVACGGSHANLSAADYLLKQEAKTFHSENINAMEFADSTPKACNKNSLVVGISLGGNTLETVTALKKAKECGAKIITVGGKEVCGIAEHSDCHFVAGLSDITYGHVGLPLRIAYEVLNYFEKYRNYKDVVKAYGKVEDLAKKVRAQAKKQGKAWADAHKEAECIYTMASGCLYDYAYECSICYLMEMQWINTNAIHSGEYFHGPFEITLEHTPFIVFESLGKTRELDERALKFLKKYSKDVEVFDAKKYGLEKLGKDADYLQPIIFGEIISAVMQESMAARNHPIFRRRYMMKEEY